MDPRRPGGDRTLAAKAALAAGLISTLFGVATVALLVGAVVRLRHRLIAFAGGLTLMGTPFFVTFSSNEHADVPLGFFILATVVLIVAGGRQPAAWGWPALAGITAGLAAWTKNEGLLFVVVVGFVFGLREFARGSWRAPGAFFAGLAVALLPLIGPGWRRLNSREWAAAAVPGLMLAGYYCVYLLSPWDLL